MPGKKARLSLFKQRINKQLQQDWVGHAYNTGGNKEPKVGQTTNGRFVSWEADCVSLSGPVILGHAEVLPGARC